MSTLNATNVKNASSVSNNVVLNTDGSIAVQAGTAAAPGIQASGDSNTGLLFPAADTVSLSTAGAERFRVSPTGSVNIAGSTNDNAANPIIQLYDYSDLGAHGEVAITAFTSTTYGSGLSLSHSRGTATSKTILNNGDEIGYIDFSGWDGTTYKTAGNISVAVGAAPGAGDMPGNMRFSTTPDGAGSGVERMRIRFDGNVLIGTTTNNANGGILQLSKGITFPATQVDATDANTLDDYEEGTWTPTILGATTAGTGTYTTQAGKYSKIGNRLFFQFQITWTAHTGGGTMRVDGLPFTVGSAVACAITVSDLTLPASTYCAANTFNGTTQIRLYSSPVGGGAAALLTLDTAATIWGTGHYDV